MMRRITAMRNNPRLSGSATRHKIANPAAEGGCPREQNADTSGHEPLDTDPRIDSHFRPGGHGTRLLNSLVCSPSRSVRCSDTAPLPPPSPLACLPRSVASYSCHPSLPCQTGNIFVRQRPPTGNKIGESMRPNALIIADQGALLHREIVSGSSTLMIGGSLFESATLTRNV
jgi:hypothetical protein